MRALLFVALVVVAAPGCACGHECSPPTTTLYECARLPEGSPGCVEPPPGGGDAIPGPGAVAPVGCRALLPYCHAFYPDSVFECTCTEHPHDGGETRYDWVCPL